MHTGRGVRPWARRRRGASQRGSDSLSDAELLICKAGHRTSQHLRGPGGWGVYHWLVKPGWTVNLDEPSEAPTGAGSLEPRCWQGRLPLRKRLFQLPGAAVSPGVLWLVATPLQARRLSPPVALPVVLCPQAARLTRTLVVLDQAHPSDLTLTWSYPQRPHFTDRYCGLRLPHVFAGDTTPPLPSATGASSCPVRSDYQVPSGDHQGGAPHGASNRKRQKHP